MAFLKKINIKAKAEDHTGFGSNAANYGGRFINKNGNPNVKKTGINFFDRISWYHALLDMSASKFIIIVLFFYFSVNFIFAMLYYAIGVEHLTGVTAQTPLQQFEQAFFFSIQTFTTVGYGHISPNGFAASFLAALEALFGLLSFALATGLFYGRFSKPQSYILISKNALIAPYKSHTALMIRISPFKNTNLTDVEAQITLRISLEEEGALVNRFFILDLEYAKINALTLSWTIVHPITETSPLYALTKEDYQTTDAEIFVYIKSFDDMFSTTTIKRTSYTFKEVIYGAKFNPMFFKSEESDMTILEIDKLNSYQIIEN